MVVSSNLIKALAILLLGAVVVYVICHLAGIDFARTWAGVALFIVLGALDLMKEAR